MAGADTILSPPGAGRWRPWHLVLAYATAIGLLSFGYVYFDDLARARSGTMSRRLLEQLTGVYCAAVLFPLVVKVARRLRLRKASWLRSVSVHLLAMVLFSLLHTSLIAVTREAIFPLAGLGDYDYGILHIRYLMEFFNDVILYWMLVGFVFVFDHFRESRDRELRTSQLEMRLARAQLESLRLQLQPHFLFNALNTVSAMIYENPVAADGMITRLGDLLRLSLRHSDAQEVTLAEELDFLDLYLDIMRARFEERLAVSIDVEPDARSALVPQLLLQPLVENSIRHAVDPESGAVDIAVRAWRENGKLIVRVSDGGPGLKNVTLPGSPAAGNGIGLANTRQRLAQLYGASHEFQLGAAEGGGLAVSLAIPFHISRGTGKDDHAEHPRDDR
jgi:two-component system, LytTR family, sensor kinase